MKTVFIENKKNDSYPECFYLVSDLSIEILDEAFGFQAEPYSFNYDFGKENGTMLDYDNTDKFFKTKFPEEYRKQAKEMTTDQLREMVDE